ncbi:OmpA family protein [Psychroflexus sediminis]|uniref:Outer membrane protein OmpA and related peptidoglycan-associated (Lipo)proteins n=1 Tax=Psychroflexus sediminis TaxID=470826 RepID=A0A1G7TWW1_9FLAO|nr:OmpA family protein [Psychroflexus sediminis]SDG39229.1 Outer membrane protein OmpA and related peptidoglycan-associated (lipo)proteins [Psychroflexus sediminis]
MKNLSILSVFCCLFTLSLWSQNSDTQKADRYFNRFDYVDAIEAYEKLIQKGKAESYVYRQLAIAHFRTSNFEEAEQFYKRYLRSSRDAEAQDYYKYAQTLLINEKYEEYKEAMLDFIAKAPRDSRALAFLENPDYLLDLQSMEPRFKLNKLSLNSDYSDFGAYKQGDKLYFVSARNEKRKTYGWDEEPSLDIYVADEVAGTFKNAKEIEGDINTKFHEGTVALTGDGSSMYFTRNDYLNENYRKDAEGINHLQIYKASLVNGVFQDVQDLAINDVSFSNANPALSPDGTQLYFSSDRPGGYGSSDLYVVDIQKDGSLGEPKNLGPIVNTEGRENFPFVDEENVLYFSSDGHLGFGGLDVYYSKSYSGNFLPPQNLGLPLNSNADDFAFSYYKNEEKGFVSSNRTEKKKGERIDDIYSASLVYPLEQTSILVEVVDAETGEFLDDAQVIFYAEDQQEFSRNRTNLKGLSKSFLPTGQKFDLQVNLRGYVSQSNALVIPDTQMLIRVALEPEMSAAEAEMLVLQERIFFDYDEASIRAEAALELDKLIAILKENPEMNIKVISHTDERASEDYNLELSQRRAKNTVKYLVEHGIDASRLTSEGKGETELINTCDSGCTEEEHKENRRSEFKIVE